MTKTVDFYFDFGSLASYLAWTHAAGWGFPVHR